MKQIITTTLTIAKPQRLALVLITLIFLPSTAWGYDNTNPTIISNFTGFSNNKITFDGGSTGQWEIYDYGDAQLESDGTNIGLKITPAYAGGGITFKLKSKFVVSQVFSDVSNANPVLLANLSASSDLQDQYTAQMCKAGSEYNNPLAGIEVTNNSHNKTFKTSANFTLSDDYIVFEFQINNCSYFTIQSINLYNLNTPTPYNLTVAGIPVTNANADNITGSNIVLGSNGKVSFTPASNYSASDVTTWATLTLDNAEINGVIDWSEPSNPDFRILVNGTSKIINSTTDVAATPAIQYTFTSTDQSPTPVPRLRISKGSADANLFVASYRKSETNVTNSTPINSKFTTPATLDDGMSSIEVYPDDPENYDIMYTCYTTATVYPNLKVADRVVHNISAEYQGYKDNILKGNEEAGVYKRNTTVTFDGNHTLTLNNATIDVENIPGILTGLDLTIELDGANTIKTNNGYAICGNGNNQNITFTSSSTPTGTLSLSREYSAGLTEKITFTESDWAVTILSGTTLADANQAIISKSYGLTIAGTEVTSANVGSDGTITITGVTGAKFAPSITYDASDNTTWAKLTLTNANIQGQIQWSKEESLIIEVNGMNKVINEKTDAAEPAISWTGTQQVPNLLIKKGDSESATLIFAGYKKASGYSVQNASNQVSGFSDPTYQGLNYGTLTNKTTDYTLVTYHCYSTEIYPVRVRSNYIQNISEEYYGHKDNVIDDSETPTVTYNNGVLTLNNANFYTGIGTGLENLTIDLKGNNIISTSTNNALLYGIGDGTHNIKFKSSSTPVGNLTLRSDIDAVSFVRNDVTITGFENDLSSTPSDLTKSVKEAFISKGTPIGLTVGNVFVTSDIWDGNGNITGVEGVRFTPANYVVDNPGASTPAILTLDNANISGNIQSSINELTVHLIGSNTITPGEGIAPFQYTGTGTGSLTFESSEADDGELTLSGAFSETGSSPNKKITSGGYTTTTEFDTGLSYTFGDWIIETSKIYYNPHYGITINSYETTKCNKDNITKTNSGGVFTYSPQAKTLSIPLDYDGSSTDIKSQRDDLIVSISGNTAIRSIIHEPSQSGTLLIKNAPSSSSTVNKLTLQNSTGAVISGFSTVTLDGLYFLTPNYPSVTTSTDWTSSINEAIITNETLSAPTMSSETVDGVSTLTLTSTAGNVPIKYSIDYVDASQTDITDAIYDSSHKPTISKPATVTAKVTLNEVESVTTTGKYFGTDPSPFRLISGAAPIVLDLTPAIEESDGISITSITGTESNVTYDAGTGKISSSSVGSFNGQVSMSSTEGKTVILNNNFTATFNVQIDISQAVITLDNTELIYNGQEQTVSVQKVMVGDDVVPQDYYEVSGNTGTEIGNYSLTVTAKTRDSQGNLIYNNYTGTATKEWKITNHPTASASELGFNTETQTFSTYYNPNEDFNLPDGYVGYIIKGIEGSKVLTVRISYIPKGVAVLVEKGSSNENPVEEIPSEQPLKGTFEPLDVTSITGGTVYVLYNGMFVKSTSGTIPEKRCYLLIDTSVAAGTRGFYDIGGANDGTSALRGVVAEGTNGKSDAWYTLQGRRLSAKPTKSGLYLHNGIKVVIK